MSFNLALDDPAYDDDSTAQKHEDSDSRLMEMLAAQAAHREGGSAAGDENSIVLDKSISEAKKKEILQKSLNMAASNGDVERVRRLISGKALDYIDVNEPDEEGIAPLIYASCFVSSRGRSSTIVSCR